MTEKPSEFHEQQNEPILNTAVNTLYIAAVIMTWVSLSFNFISHLP